LEEPTEREKREKGSAFGGTKAKPPPSLSNSVSMLFLGKDLVKRGF
jgi:hypothetical protein